MRLRVSFPTMSAYEIEDAYIRGGITKSMLFHLCASGFFSNVTLLGEARDGPRFTEKVLFEAHGEGMVKIAIAGYTEALQELLKKREAKL